MNGQTMKHRHRGAALTLSVLLALSAPAHAAPATASPADASFQTIYQQEWQWRISQRLADDEDLPKGMRPELPHVDAATQEARRRYWEDVLKRLDAIRPAELSSAERINYAVYRAQISALLEAQRFREYEQPVNADSAFWTDVTYSARRAFKSADEYHAYIAQLRDMPRYFREQLANMRAGLARGFTPPRVTLAGREAPLVSIAQARSPQDTIFYTPFRTMPANIPPEEQARLRAAGIAAIRDSVQPAHAEVLAYVRSDYFPHARTLLAAESLPDGKAYYQSKIVEYTTTSLSAGRIHEIGLAEMAKIHAEMQAAMRQAGFHGELPAFLAFLRGDPQFYAKTPDELLMRAAWIAKKFDGKAEQFFGYLPRRRFAIVPVPPDQAPYYTSARGGPGMYLVNTWNLPARGPVQPAGPDAARIGPGPRLPDAGGARTERRASVPPGLHFGVWRGLGPVLRTAGQRDGHL
jgi:uncharacterized protein (DUF885 family)